MSSDQATPSIVVIQPSFDELEDSRSLSRSSSVGRSNSAPQSQNKFTSSRMGLKSKDSPPSPSINQSKQSVGDNQIPTLSDGVVLIDQDQTVVTMASDSQQFNSQSHSPMSPTPLCDTNHSPSSTKIFYEQTTKMLEEEPKPSDVWQRREHFVSSGQSDNLDSLAHKGSPEDNNVFQFPNNNNNNDNISHKYGVNCHGSQFDASTNNIPESDGAVNGKHCAAAVCDSNEHTMRRSPGRKPLRQAQSEILPNEVARKISLADMNQKGYAKLEEELGKAQRALALKDEEVDELRGIRERLMKEVSDFTASLFEEVNSQLNEAALGEQAAKRQLQEANCKIEVLSAEVSALKDLVLTSTPSSPNKHLHPQIDTQPSKKDKGGKPFWKTHRRSTSHHQFTQEAREMAEAKQSHSQLREMDTVVFDEFSRWRLQPALDFTSQFLSRIQQEDIQPCLNFRNTQLAGRLGECVQNNTLSIEPIPGDSSFPRKCCLSESHKLCNYKIRLEGSEVWYSISPMCRNRITAVCDFFAYIRYIIQGLVKSSEKDMFVQLVKLRHQMAKARLGLI